MQRIHPEASIYCQIQARTEIPVLPERGRTVCLVTDRET